MKDYRIIFHGNASAKAPSESLAEDKFLENTPEGVEYTDIKVVLSKSSEELRICGNAQYLLYFAVSKCGDYVYLSERTFDNTKIRLLDMIDDACALNLELEWTQLDKKYFPGDAGMYQAIVQFVQTAEDDYQLVVTHCVPVCTL